MFKLTEDEQVYAKQLFDTRKQMHQLMIEEATNHDRLASILRGHQAMMAEAGNFTVSRVVMAGREFIVVYEHGRLPNGV
jgi:hypothetical protein